MSDESDRILEGLERIDKRLERLESELGKNGQVQISGRTVFKALENIDYTIRDIHRMLEGDVLNASGGELRFPGDSIYNHLLLIGEKLSDIRSYLGTIETRFGAVEARLSVIEVRLR
jgi:hypothetical protein